MLFELYTTGTITLNNGETAFTGSGTALELAQVKQGDLIIADGVIGVIGSISGEESGDLEVGWAGPDLVDVEYQILIWPDKYIELQDKVRVYLASVQATAVMYAVEGEEPDPSLGVDDQWALKADAGAWKLWRRVGGEWVLQGSAAGFEFRGLWDVDGNYVANDIVHRLGKAYAALRPTVGDPPESSPDDWELFAEGGSQYELVIWDNGRSISAEVIFRMTFVTETRFPVNFAGSRGDAVVAPTADAVYAMQKNGVTFGTIVFPAGISTPTFNCAEEVTFDAGDKLTVVAPDPADATLADVSVTIIAYK